MLYAGIDYHKKWSQITVLKQTGEVFRKARVESRSETLKAFFDDIPEEIRGVVEAGRNLCWIYDQLNQCVSEVVVAHPLKVKAIACAKIKTDEIDSRVLADLLRADLIPPAHVPSLEIRGMRKLLHQHIALVRMRTQVKNRIHAIVEQYPEYAWQQECSDLFGRWGQRFLQEVELSMEDRRLLNEERSLLDELNSRITRNDRWLAKETKGDEIIGFLRTLPGIGPFFSALLRAEIDDIDRFPNAKKLCSFAGLVPSTYASGDRTFHGRITKQGNRTIRWAMVEAVRPAITHDWMLRQFYERLKAKHGSNAAKVATARRLLTLVYHVWKDRRPYYRVNQAGMSRTSTRPSP